MTGASIDASLDAQVRAAAEAARSHEVPFSPPVEVLAAEAGGAEEAPGGMGMDSLPFAVPPAPYVPPKSPFRLVFGFDSAGRYVDAEVQDPVFLWTDSGGTSLKTATVDGRISVAGTETKVYLCVCRSRAGEYKSAKVATAEQADRGDDVWTNVELYEIDASEGVKRDYRHAWITVGVGGSRHSPEPFDYKVEGSGRRHVLGGDFYFDGELQRNISGIDISGSGEETVYLVCTGTKVEPEEGEESAGDEYEWEFDLATEEGNPGGSDEKVMNVKLYDFLDGEVTKDYRETNLPVSSGGIQYRKTAGDGASIDWTTETEEGEDKKLEVKGFSGAGDGAAPYKSGDEIAWDGKAITRADTSGGEVTVEFADGDSIALSKVATSGSYNDLADKPTIPTVNNPTVTIKQGDQSSSTALGSFSLNQSGAATIYVPKSGEQEQADWDENDVTKASYIWNKPTLATVATSGSYNDLANKPTIPAVGNGRLTFQLAGTTIGTFTANQSSDAQVNFTQTTLVEGTNITLTPSQDGSSITISATGGGDGSSGYSTPSGTTDRSVAEIRYDASSQQLQVKYHHDTYEDGLLKSRTTDSAWQLMEGGQAVAETV